MQLLPELEKLRDLRDGWDSYSALSPDEIAFRHAYAILPILKKYGLIPRQISPSADGGIAFNFIGIAMRRAYIEMANDGWISTVLYGSRYKGTETHDWPASFTDLGIVSGEFWASQIDELWIAEQVVEILKHLLIAEDSERNYAGMRL